MEPAREGRSSLRIDDQVHLRVRFLSEPEFNALADRFPAPENDGLTGELHRISMQMEKVITTIRDENAALARYLQMLDDKIELVARRLEDALGGVTPDTRVNLGTGGLAYWRDSALPIGTKLELHLVLFPAHVHVDALAKVVHSEEDPRADAGQRFRVGVEFQCIAKGDQEALARHLVELQSAQLQRPN